MTGAFVNPIGPGLVPGRVDMGVDYSGSGPLYALGDGTIVSTKNSGWPGGTFIGLKLAGSNQYVYYAENIIPHVQVGQTVKAGDLVGTAVGTSPFIEVGFAAAPGTGQTMAAATGQNKAGLAAGDPGAFPTGWGVTMSNLIQSLGGPAGIVNGSVQGTPGNVQVPSGSSSSGSNPSASTVATSVPTGCLMSFGLFSVVGYALQHQAKRRRDVSGHKRYYG